MVSALANLWDLAKSPSLLYPTFPNSSVSQPLRVLPFLLDPNWPFNLWMNPFYRKGGKIDISVKRSHFSVSSYAGQQEVNSHMASSGVGGS